MIQTRLAPTLTASSQYGVADRMLIGVTGATTVSGTVGIFANSGFSYGVGYGAIAASWTSGSFTCKHRIESINVLQSLNKTITISGNIYQNTGTARTFLINLGYASVNNNFTTVTNISTSPGIIVSSGTVTPFSFTSTLNSVGILNGLEINVYDNSTNTVTNVTYAISDLQFVIGTALSSYPFVDYSTELIKCRRYLPVGIYSNDISTSSIGFCNTSTSGIVIVNYFTTARISPSGISNIIPANFSILLAKNGSLINTNTILFSNAGLYNAELNLTFNNFGSKANDSILFYSNNITSMLYFTGCEL